jgi:hypothetical protein
LAASSTTRSARRTIEGKTVPVCPRHAIAGPSAAKSVVDVGSTGAGAWVVAPASKICANPPGARRAAT